MTKRKQASKVTTGHKISLAAISVMGAVAGWNAIGRVESSNQAIQPVVSATPEPIVAQVTPWPTIPPLANIPRLAVRPLPTLAIVVGSETQGDSLAPAGGGMTVSINDLPVPGLAPMPTLAPLPTMPEYVAPPPPPPPSAPVQVAAAPAPSAPSAPPPPPPPSNGGGGNVSAGS